MKILLAFDSFKGSLSAMEACRAAKEGILKTHPGAEITMLPLADGGEGTVRAVTDALRGDTVRVRVNDPLGKKITARYTVLSGATAVMEMSAASGIMLIKNEQLNPNITSTFGTGEMIISALDRGVGSIIIGIGGSATNDAGTGMLRALGARFLDGDGNVLPEGGRALIDLERIDLSCFDKRILKKRLIVACDVDSTLCGENGATRMFARQKGASDDDIEVLEKALMNFGTVSHNQLGKDLLILRGGGAAGGLGAALCAYCGGTLQSGFETVSGVVGLEDEIERADIVITGEGKTDYSSFLGKVPVGVLSAAKEKGKPCVLLSGDITCENDILLSMGFSAVHKARPDNVTVKRAMSRAAFYLSRAAEGAIA